MEPTDAAPLAAPKGITDITEEQVCRDLYLLKLLEDPPTLIAFGNTAAAELAGLPTLGTIQEWAQQNNLAVHHYGFGCFGIKVRGEEVASFDAGGAMLNTDSSGDRRGVSYTHITFRSTELRRSWLEYLCRGGSTALDGTPGHVELALKASHQRRVARKEEIGKQIGVLTAQQDELQRRIQTDHSYTADDVQRRGPGAYGANCVCGWGVTTPRTASTRRMMRDHLNVTYEQRNRDAAALERTEKELVGLRIRLSELDQPGDYLLPK